MNQPSLQHQLNLGLSLTLAVLLLLLWWLTAGLMERLAEELISARLKHDAETLLQAVALGHDGTLSLTPDQIPHIYHRPLSGHYYQLQQGAQPIRSRSLWDAELPKTELPPGEQRSRYIDGPADQPLLLRVAGYRKQGQAFTLSLGEDISATRDRLLNFHLAFGLLTLTIIIASLLAQRIIVRRALRTLDTLRTELSQLEQGRISNLSEQVPAEIRPLVEELNRLLRLLSERLQRSRNGLGNLAHAVKRPINLIRQHLDRNQGPIDPAEIRRFTEDIRQLTERELKRARLAGAPTPGRLFDPRAELPQLLELLQRIHGDKRIDARLQIDTRAPLSADRDDMLELFGNLLDNAFKWAESRVQCRVSEHRITILDDGPGCEPALLRRITQRGARLDEATEGHGLGLAIVRDLVQLYGGTIRLENVKPQGLKVVVEL